MSKINEIKMGYQVGIKAHGTYIYAPCEICGETRWTQAILDGGAEYKARYPTCKSCSASISGFMRNPDTYTTEGYVWIRLSTEDKFCSMASKNGWVKRSRLTIARKLDRCLTPDEIVHHKDGNPSNDNENNLELTTQAKHTSTHSAGRFYRDRPDGAVRIDSQWKIQSKCADCGKIRLVVIDKDGNPKSARCPSCANKLNYKLHGPANWKGGISLDRKAYMKNWRDKHKWA